MRMDLTITDYPDRAALERYMYGSAEVIGLQLLPVLGTVGAREEAAPYAAALGKAFQLTNFLRDVDEDLERGRVYLPADELAAHGVDRDVLTWCHDQPAHRPAGPPGAGRAARRSPGGSTTTRGSGIALLHPRSRPCVAAALTLYSEILDRIEEIDFAVFDQRASVGTLRRLQVAAVGLAKAWRRACPAHQDVTMDRWQYLFVLAACLLITAPLEFSGRACIGRRAALPARSCRWQRCSWCGMRWPSPATYGPTTRVTSPGSSYRAPSQSRSCCSSW